MSDIRALFRERFGAEPGLAAVAPGRVNLIGEHTDYNDGFVFPAAIDRTIELAAAITDGPTRLYSAQVGAGDEFDARTVVPGGADGWSGYAAGVAWALREKGAELPNIVAVVDGEVPIGSGVSSSAAIELVFGVAWNALAGLGLSNVELAKVGQRAENGFVGVNSGIMDQMASAMGRAGHALFLDTRTLDIRHEPIPDGLSLALCDTGKPRALTDSAYNERRSQCEEAARLLGVKALRDADDAVLQAAEGRMNPLVFRRARHVVTENARCLRFAEALRQQRLDLLAELMHASHVSLRDDYEVSSPERDAMAEAAWAAPGCVGARMTGAGFGGACVALVRSSEIPGFSTATMADYRRRPGMEGSVLPCQAVDGARLFST